MVDLVVGERVAREAEVLAQEEASQGLNLISVVVHH